MKNLSNYWLEEIVIGLDLCPFAKHPYQNGLVRLIESELISESDQLSFFLDELEKLQQTSPLVLSTTLIVFTNDKNDFDDFNDFIGICEDILIESGLEEHFQLVVFHPEYIFENKSFNERVNYIGRSPYPTIHILRNAEIEAALENFKDLDNITAKNEEKLNSLSEDQFQKYFYYLSK